MTVVVTGADYRGELVAGKRWRRAYRVVIGNPYGGGATAAFDEEEVSQIDASISAHPTVTLTTDVDLAAVIDLIDPSTGLPMGATMTHGQVYVALYSLYRALGDARDAAEAAAAAQAALIAAQRAGL